jgi:threonine dehydratase
LVLWVASSSVGETIVDALVKAREFAEQDGAVLNPPVRPRRHRRRPGHFGLEILKQIPDVATSTYRRRWRADRRDCRGGHFLAPQVRVIENAGPNAAAWPGSLAAGKPVCAASMSTMADGIAVAVPGGVPFAHVRAFADSVRTVSEDALSRAAAVHGAAKLIVEPAGAAAVAVLMTSVPELGLRSRCARCCRAAISTRWF